MTKQNLYGSFFKCSPNAGSYRGDLLRLLAIHTILVALETFYNTLASEEKVCCNNQGVLYK